MGKGEESLTGAQTDMAVCTVGADMRSGSPSQRRDADMRSRSPSQRRDADIPHTTIAEGRSTVRKVRGTTAGNRKGKEGTMT